MDSTLAACRGTDTDLFYDPDRLTDALAFCNSCPIQVECLRANAAERDGVWAVTERARRRLRSLVRNGAVTLSDADLRWFIDSTNHQMFNPGSARTDPTAVASASADWVRAVRADAARVSLDVVAHKYGLSRRMARKLVAGEVRADVDGVPVPV